MKKKILFINGHLNIGGVEKSLVDILKHMDYDKFEVDLLLLEGLGDYLDEIPSQVNICLRNLENTYGPIISCFIRCIKNKDWFSLRMRLIFLIMKLFGQKNVKIAKKILTDNKYYDCVVGFRSGICTTIAAYGVDAKKKIAWWHHGEFNVLASEYEQVISACSVLVSVSQSCADMIAEKIPSIKNKLVVIANMVDTEELKTKSEQEFPYSDNVVNIVTVCRISPEKHVENIIYSAKKLKVNGFHFCWHIVGDGITKKDIERMSAEYGVDDCVLFEGSKTNPYPYIKSSSLYVHPSYVESQGLTILEAMALEVPCVVTKSKGPCEFVIDKENGLLVNHGWICLEEGVEKMLKNRELYKKIKENTKCPDKFLPKNVIRSIENLFLN